MGRRPFDVRETPNNHSSEIYYAIVVGMIGTGIGLLGIAQALRLLIWIYGTDSGDFR
jgi:hypothetical protein